MPPTSQKQRRFMYAVKEGKVPGVKPSVGQEFEADDHQKGLPESAATEHRKSDAHADHHQQLHQQIFGQ